MAFCSDGEMVHIVTDGGNSTCNVGGVVSKPLIIESVGDPEVITVDSKSEQDYNSYPTPQNVILVDDNSSSNMM